MTKFQKVIGFVSIGKIDLVIEQIEALFKIEMKTTLKNKYDGRLFPITVKNDFFLIFKILFI